MKKQQTPLAQCGKGCFRHNLQKIKNIVKIIQKYTYVRYENMFILSIDIYVRISYTYLH